MLSVFIIIKKNHHTTFIIYLGNRLCSLSYELNQLSPLIASISDLNGVEVIKIMHCLFP